MTTPTPQSAVTLAAAAAEEFEARVNETPHYRASKADLALIIRRTIEQDRAERDADTKRLRVICDRLINSGIQVCDFAEYLGRYPCPENERPKAAAAVQRFKELCREGSAAMLPPAAPVTKE